MARLYIHFDANPIRKQFNGNSKELQRCHEKKKKKENSMKRGVLSVHQKRDEKEAIVMCNFDVAALCRVGA